MSAQAGPRSHQERVAAARKRFPLVKNCVAQVAEDLAVGVPPETLEQLLLVHDDKLSACDDPFPPASGPSRSQVNSGSVTMPDGRKIVVSDKEKEVVLRLSERLDLDEVAALVLWRQFWTLNADKPEDHFGDDSESMLESAEDFYFTERQAVLSAFAAIMHKADEDASPVQDVCLRCLERIAQPSMPTQLLASFVKRTKQILPEHVRSSARSATRWAKALIREQKLLLEVVFLLFYGRVPSHAGYFVSLLNAISSTNWGQDQESYAFFDPEASALGESIAHILTLIAVEVSQVDVASDPNFGLASDPGPNDLTNPARLKEINQVVCNLVVRTPQRAAPVGLAWTYVLSRVTELYESAAANGGGLPEAHRQFAEIILAASSLSNGDDMVVAQSEADEDQPLYERLTAHILSPTCDLFGHLQRLLVAITIIPPRGSGNARGAREPNTLGYLVTSRNLLSCLPLLLKLPYLSPAQLRAAIETFALTFELDTTYALAEDFWSSTMKGGSDRDGDEEMSWQANEAPLLQAEREYLEVARNRFPATLGPFLKLLRALSGLTATASDFPEDSVTSATRASCAAATLEYLANLQSLTFALPPTPMLVPLPYESIPSDEGGQALVKTVRPIHISPSVIIPTDVIGTFLSGAGQKPVIVCWQIQWSAWALFGDIVEEWSGLRARANKAPTMSEERGPDFFGESADEPQQPLDPTWVAEELVPTNVSSVLEILAAVIEGVNTPSSKRRLEEELSYERPPAETVEGVFALLERSVSGLDLQANTAQASLRVVGQLIRVFPLEVWTMLRGSKFLFPALSESKVWRQAASSHSILQREKLAGTYIVTLAVLDVILQLWEFCRLRSLSGDIGSAQISSEVLLRALAWVRDEVWPGFLGWKYVRLADKFRIAYKCALLFGSIGQEAIHCAPTSKRRDAVAHDAFDFFKASFISQAAVTSLNTLVYLLTPTAATVATLQAEGRLIDADALLCAVDATLQLTEAALSLRQSVLGNKTSLLERLFLSSTGADDVASTIQALSYWCQTPDQTGTTATRVCTLLMTLAKDWPSEWPSLVENIGDGGQGSTWVNQVVARAIGAAHNHETDEGVPDALAWQLLTAMIESQPAIALRLVGDVASAFPPDRDASAPTSALGGAISRIILRKGKAVEGDKVLASSLAFLETVCQRAVEFKRALAGPSKDRKLCDALTEIVLSTTLSTPNPPDESFQGADAGDQAVAACVQNLSRAYASRILAILMQIATPEVALGSSGNGAPAATAVESFRQSATATPERFSDFLTSAMKTAADPGLQETAISRLESSAEWLDLEEFRNVTSIMPYDRIWRYGASFVYDFDTVTERLREDGPASEDSALAMSLGAINLNLSTVDSQLALTRSCQQLLEVFLSRTKVGEALPAALCAVAKDTADETRQGDFMVSVHAARLATLLTGFEGATSAKAGPWLFEFLGSLARIAVSEAFPLLDSARRQTPVAWHRPYLRLVYFVLRRINELEPSDTDRTTWQSGARSAQTIFAALLDVTEDIFVLARAGPNPGLEADVGICASLFADLLGHPLLPSTAISPNRIHDITEPALGLLGRTDVVAGRPVYAQNAVTFLAAVASLPRLAEQLATHGVMLTLLDNGLTALAENGGIAPLDAEIPHEEAPIHQLWCSIVALVTSLMQSLGRSQQFVSEVAGFALRYGNQLTNAFSGVTHTALSLADLRAADVTSSLLYTVLSKGEGNPLPAEVARLLIGPALVALQHLAHCLTHPHSTASWLAADVTVAPALRELSEADLLQDTLRRVLRVSRNLLLALGAHTRSMTILTRDVFEWPLELTIVWPTRSAVSGEPASIGTLLELADAAFDATRDGKSSEALKSEAEEVLEASLVLAVSQLALWERRPSHPHVRNVGRMRRELGELVPEVLELIDKASLPTGGSRSSANVTFGGSPLKRQSAGEGTGKSAAIMKALGGFVRDHLTGLS